MREGGFPMSISQVPSNLNSTVSAPEHARPSFRTKTVATRLTPAELAEVESAAEKAAKPLSEWLRETALRTARQQPADPLELLLAEMWAMRYVLLNHFHAGALAAAEGKQIFPDSILKVRDEADARKLQHAQKLIEDFVRFQEKNRSM